jgi:hypothetical protein
MWWRIEGLTRKSQKPIVDALAQNMPILDTANWIDPYGKDAVGWDYVSLLPGSRAATAKNIPENDTKHYSEAPKCKNNG